MLIRGKGARGICGDKKDDCSALQFAACVFCRCFGRQNVQTANWHGFVTSWVAASNFPALGSG